MKKFELVTDFDADIKTVWDVMTNNEDYFWRSDLSRIEILNDLQFKEYNKKDFVTKMTITTKKECVLYEFDMDNKNMKGHWIGQFSSLSNGGTRVIFIEYIELKSNVLKPFLYIYIKKSQKTYVQDLKNRLDKKAD